MHILVVDDSKVMRMKLKSVIGGAGIPVTALLEAEHGREALGIIDQQQVDMVFTDINMPEMDGREFLKELSGRTLPRPVYRVVCTTETPQALRDELNGYGVNLYIEKPFNADAVKQALAAAHAARAA
jgi:two-component system chemotaxis response regulator CheY